MSLPTKNLDDRTFQQLVDEARRRIGASCPTWTDHNVSDPGITLVELFAWMTEMILYRLNQVPEKNYIKFMDLLGLELQEPEPARTEVTFYLSSPQPADVVVGAGTEVATVRTETRPAIVFTTDDDLVVQPPSLHALITRTVSAESGGEVKLDYREQNLKQLGVSGHQFAAFSQRPQIGDALYFGFKEDLSNHVLGFEIECETALGTGIDPSNPPWQWEVWFGGDGDDRWRPAVVEEDTTGGMNQPGLIRVRLPEMRRREIRKRRAYWVRCRVIEPAVEGTDYEKTPLLRDVEVASWGGTVWATHASLVRNETLGRSEGSPGQRFQVENQPLLRRKPGETVELRLPGEETWEAWEEVTDFSESDPEDRHFTWNSATGEIRFGPALRFPDGSVRAFGAIPPRGAMIRCAAYRHGGGVEGNVQGRTLTVLKTSIPYIDRVINHNAATGGLDSESIELAQVRAPRWLRSRGRAVTPEDFETLAREADARVHRARCVQPGGNGGGNGTGGQVFLMLVPKVYRPDAQITPERLTIDDDLRESVASYLDDYRLLTVRLDIREPEYVWVAVELNISAMPDADPERVRRDVERRLHQFLNPVVGGPEGEGWPFGRDLYPSDVYASFQGVSGIEYIESMKLYLAPPGGEPKDVSGSISVPVHGLVASSEHRVKVR